MPEVNFNLLNPDAALYSGPNVVMDPQKAYAEARAQRQSNMLAQLYAKHYDPQTGGINYNSLIGEAAQDPVTASAIPTIMGEAQKQSQSMAEIAQKRALQQQEEATAAAKQDEMRREKVKEMAIESYGRFRSVKNADDLLAWHLANPELPGTNKAERTARLQAQLAQPGGYETARSEIESALQDITGIKPEKVAETDIAKLLREQKNYKVNSPEWKTYQRKIDEASGGMTEYQRQQLQLDRDRIKLLQDKAESGEGTKTEGKELLTSQIISLRDAYDGLAAQGGIVDTKQPWYKNLSAWVGTTGVGQTVGKAIGTDTQSLRNTIAQSRPLLLNAIKQATGMSSKQLDSNAELKMYLAAATDPTLDVQANRKALRALDKMYGLGIDLGPIDENAPAASTTPAVTSAAPAAKAPPKVGEIVKGHKFKGGNPSDPKSWEVVK